MTKGIANTNASLKFQNLPKPIASNYYWQNDGNCVDMPLNNFFHEENERASAKHNMVVHAKSVCASCPVKSECLRHAMSVPEQYGVWGGMTEDERRLLLRRTGGIRAHRKRERIKINE